MKNLKLNKKGFTLIELLAVIVILAIVMVVTIPTVLDTIASYNKKQFQNAAQTVQKWLDDQYTLYNSSSLSGTTEGVNTLFASKLSGVTVENGTTIAFDGPLLIAAGFNGGAKDASGTAVYNSTYNKWCVTLTATADGKFAKSGEVKSSACPESNESGENNESGEEEPLG